MRSYRQREMGILILLGILPLGVGLGVAWALLQGSGLLGFVEESGKQLQQALDQHEALWQKRIDTFLLRFREALEKEFPQAAKEPSAQALPSQESAEDKEKKSKDGSGSPQRSKDTPSQAQMKSVVERLRPDFPWLRGIRWGKKTVWLEKAPVEEGFEERKSALRWQEQSIEVLFGTPLPLLERSRWALFFRINKAQAEAQRAGRIGFFWATFSILAATILLAILLGLSLTGFLLRELRELRQQIAQATPQESGWLAPKSFGSDELAGLRHDLASMIRHLQQQQQNEVFREQVARWQDIARRLAHEIKNPLTPIQLAIQQLVRSYRDNNSQYKALLQTSEEIIQEEVDTLRRLVEEFSSFAKLPAVEPQITDVNQLLREYLEAYDWFRGKVEIHLDTPSEPLWAMVDRMLFRSVLHNLVLNAIEAGAPSITLRSGRVMPRQIICQVEDQGPGIPVHLQSRIFTPYFTTKQFGTGLGLAIAKKIVIDHGGSITVGANERNGATFSILLPEARSFA